MKVQWQVSARQITFGTIQNLVVFPYYFIYYENFVNVILLFSTKTRASYKLEQKSSICVPSFESVGSYRDLHQTKLRSNNAREFFAISQSHGQRGNQRK